VACGEDTYFAGQSHDSRRNIGLFDMLLVTRGSLSMVEKDMQWDVEAGECLILRPDEYHYSMKPCKEETHFYWLHFQSQSKWFEMLERERSYFGVRNHYKLSFNISIPRYRLLLNRTHTYEQLRSLLTLRDQPMNSSRWEEQTIFQKLFYELHDEQKPLSTLVSQLADNTAAYIRRNFVSPITCNTLGEIFNFHPCYITRCMKKVYGCTPLEYLTLFRLQQSKALLIDTVMPIGRISEAVGFNSGAYFTKCFYRSEKIAPLKFRQQYKHKNNIINKGLLGENKR
jgi:YesN/AraC family two-component response regulator